MRRILLLLLTLLCLGAECEERRLDGLDNGEPEATPLQLPWVVLVDDSVDFPLEWLTEEVDWFNDTASRDGVAREWFVMWELGSPELSATDDGTLTVEVGYTGDGEDYVEEEDTSVSSVPGTYDFARRGDMLLYGTITVSSDISYHERTVRDVLRHEMGHAMGLAHDECSEDLNSIMGVCLIYDGELTQKDWESLL